MSREHIDSILLKRNQSELEVLEFLVDCSSDDELKDVLIYDYDDEEEDDEYEYEYGKQDGDLYENIKKIKKLMLDNNCSSLEQLLKKSLDTNIENRLNELIDDIVDDVLDDDEYVDYLKDEFSENIEEFENEVKYAQVVIDMLKKKLPDPNDYDVFLTNQRGAVMFFNKLIQDNEDLTIESPPVEFIKKLNSLGKKPELSQSNIAFTDWQKSLEKFQRKTRIYRRYPETQKKYMKNKILSSPITPISNPLSSNNRIQNPQQNNVGIGFNGVNQPMNDIKELLKTTLDGFVSSQRISSYTTAVEKTTKQNEKAYETRITANNKTTTIRIAKDGTKAHMQGKFNAESYKLLLDTFIKTRGITAPNDITPIGISDPSELKVAKTLIIKSLNEYRATQNISPIIQQEDEISNSPGVNL